MANDFSKNDVQERATPDSAASGNVLLQTKWVDRICWLIPICIVFAVYHVCLNNYFTSDDFMWLDRGRTFQQNRLQIFRSEGAYFDPLVHLMFAADYFIAGLNPRWYHWVDLSIHAANSLLVYRFAQQLNDDRRAALYCSILFAGSFAIADAVLWPSSRVDLLATFFSLASLIQFLYYLRGNKSRNLLFSFLLFVFAMGAKGTPIVLPIILLLLIIIEKKPLRLSLRLIPFGVIGVIYLVLLKLTAHLAAFPVDKVRLCNPHNFAVAVCAQFIPENILTHLHLGLATTLLFTVISALALATFKSTVALRRIGYFFFLAGTVPVLFLGDFTLANNHSNFIDLMGSPSHRIYLASVGVALLGGGLIKSIEEILRKVFPRFALITVVIFLAGVVLCDAFLVHERDQLWEDEGEKARSVVDYFNSYRSQAAEDSQVGLIGFPTSRVYMEPMIKERLGINEATFNYYVDIGILVDAKILQKAEKSFLFIFGRDGHIYDESQLYRQQLLLSRRAISNLNNLEYISEAQTVTFDLTRKINLLLAM